MGARSILDLAVDVLETAAPADKCAAADAVGEALRSGAPLGPGRAPPQRPARPERPALLPPRDVPKRKMTNPAGRIALIHAVAHIELNAIDLAFDMTARFTHAAEGLGLDPAAFAADWIAVGIDEARHFTILQNRLSALGARYGDLPAHDGLWRAAMDTADDILARLAIAPMVLEARGLDVTPTMIKGLSAAGDEASADLLRVIYQEEVDHVRKGATWFHRVCNARGLEPAPTFHHLVETRFAGQQKPPFNSDARSAAGLPEDFYAEQR